MKNQPSAKDVASKACAPAEVDEGHGNGPRDPKVELIQTAIWLSPFDMVRQFHAKVGQIDALAPNIAEHRELRIRLITEEFKELREALEENDIVCVADALADLLYVVIGSGLQWGIPLEAVFCEVHRSNMTKTLRRALRKYWRSSEGRDQLQRGR